MKSRHPVLFTLILLSILIAGSHLCAFDALREREPVIVFSNRFPQFINSPVEQIFAFAFDADTHTWRQIPHQIDERDAERGYFGEVNGLLDLNEEILFMAHDAGDRASPLYWPGNADSKNYTRYEFEISDPEFPGESRYIYLFRSTTLSNSPNLPSYLTYFPSSGGSDKVVGASYSEEHTDAIPKHWIIPPEAGGAGLDFLDRQKARVNGNHSIIGSLKLTEDDLNYKSGNIFYVAGPIRISRKAVFEIKIKKLGITLTAVDISFVKQYYPYHIHHLKANKKLDKEWGISLIRQSFDFNFNGIGMQFYNPYNHVLIDGVSDVIDHTMHLEPDYNWYCATGDAGTIVNIFQVDNVGSTQELYYWDKTNNTTYDGTKETGYDKKSYGDAGVLFRGSDMEGSLGMPMMIHFLAANQDSIIGPQLMDNLLNPLNIDIEETSFVENIIAEIPDTSQRQGLDIDIPIRLQDVSGLDLTSCDMTIAFDGSVIEALDASTTLMTAEWELTQTLYVDSITIHLEGAMPIEGSGDLLTLSFRTVGDAGTRTDVSAANMSFNAGTVEAEVNPGTFTVLEPERVTISVPDTSQEKGLTIAIPVKISGLDDASINSVQLKYAYNGNVLDFLDITSQNTLTSTWDTPDYDANNDTLTIALSGASPLPNDGTLLLLEFSVIGEPGDTSPLNLSDVAFNDGYPFAEVENGLFTTLAPPLIELSLPDTTGVMRTTFDLPLYVEDVTGLNINSFNFTISFDQDVLDATGIEITGSLCESWKNFEFSDDPGQLDIAFTGSPPLVGSGVLLYVRFDVTGSGNDTSSIALKNIMFNNGNPEGISSPSLFTTLFPTVAVSLPDTSGIRGRIVSIPVSAGDVSGLDITTFRTFIEFDADVIEFLDVNTKGSLSETWSDLSVRNYRSGAYISAGGEQPLQGSGDLLYLNFYVIGEVDSTTELNFRYFLFNDGAVPSALTNGSFTVSGEIPKIAISIPDTAAMEEQTIRIPVRIGDVTGLNIRAIQISLSFNQMVINAHSIIQEGTISADADSVKHVIRENRIDIYVRSAEPLQGSGQLVFIDFDVTGSANTSTLMHFESVVFNDGFPVALPGDGLFTVQRLPRVAISIPQMSGNEGDYISMPLRVSDLSGLDVLSLDLEIEVDGAVLYPMGVDQTNTLTAGWSIVELNKDVNTISLRTEGSPALIGYGDLLRLDFEVVGGPGDESGIVFNRVRFNDGIPAAIPINSVFRVQDIVNVTVSLPDTTVMSGTSIRVPIMAGDLTGLDVTSFRTGITYNPDIVQPVSMSNEGTLTEGWDIVRFNAEDNRLEIEAQGASPVTGSGSLCDILFDVIGADSSQSPLGFVYFLFDEGIPNALYDDGSITIEGLIPVELATFEAVVLEDRVHLSWMTLSETNNLGFEVQKSNDLTAWAKLGFVRGQGTSSKPNQYHYEDSELTSGTSYYRLKQIDQDGSYRLSDAISVTTHVPEELLVLQNYPNPFNASTTIRFRVPENSGVEIGIYNILGEEIAMFSGQNYHAGYHNVEWSGEDSRGNAVPSGIYIYKIRANGTEIIKKMLLLR